MRLSRYMPEGPLLLAKGAPNVRQPNGFWTKLNGRQHMEFCHLRLHATARQSGRNRMSMTPTICDAITRKRCLTLRYDGFSRLVEAHACGASTAGHLVVRVWQVSGGSVHNERTGWKLLRLDEIRSLAIADEPSHAPRSGYRRGDRDMTRIVCQI